MPSKTPKQAKFMRAIAHGWKPSRMKSPPSRAVAQEFVEADKKYSGGFAENRYWRGGLAAMDNPNAGFQGSLDNPFQWQEGGEVDYRVPGEPGVYEAPDVEGMGPALEQMFADMEATQKEKEKEVIDYTWDKTQSREAETALDEKLEAMSGPEQVEYVKPRLLAAMQEMKTIGESPKFKKYSIKDYWLSTDQVSLWRGKWSEALQKQAREAGTEEKGMQRGGRTGRSRNGGGGTSTTTNVPTVTSPPPPSPYGTEAGTTQQMLDRMGYSGPMGYLRLTSGLRQAGWTPASGSGDGDLRNTMWYPPEGTLTGENGPGEPPPRIIPTTPASYVGLSAEDKEALKESPYRDKLREHQANIESILGSARGGHVNYYQEGGEVLPRPGHAEGPNPYEGDPLLRKSYARWEKKHHIDPAPPPPPEVAEEVEEEGGVAGWLRSLFVPDPETARVDKLKEALEREGEGMFYGGPVGYQTGGLAIAAPRGGVPPWVEPMGDPAQGYQFGGIANRGQPAPAAAPQPGGGRGLRGRMGRARQAYGLPGGGRPQGGLAAMYGQAQAQQAGGLPPGIDPRAVAANPQGYARQQMEAARRGLGPGGGSMGIQAGGYDTAEQLQQRYDTEQARRAEVGIDPLAYDRPTEGRYQPGEGEMMNRRFPGGYGNILNRMNRQLPGGKQLPGRRIAPPPGKFPGGGGVAPGNMGTLGGPGYGRYPLGSAGPRVDPSDPSYRGAPPPGSTFTPGGGGMIGGPRVPPNMRGYLQKMRMQNRPPSGPVGGGGNRVGMQDQQGALSRALQRGTGRPPMSRRSGFGRAGPTR